LTGRIRKTKTITTAGEWLEEHCDVPNHRMRMPIGIDATDHFIETIETISGKKITEKYKLQRGRLVDSYIDGHKYVFGKKAIVIGDEDMVSGLVSFLSEIGIIPVIVASGGESGLLKEEIEAVVEDPSHIQVMNGADFESIREVIRETKPDLLIGSSKGYYIARELGIPLIRVGFPIHDRVGGPRMEHLFYSGAQQLFDRIVNALLEYKQEHSPIGYKYM
jgi:nitrogenase molybdenum-iron protein NifN